MVKNTKENLLTTVFQFKSRETFYSNDSKRVIQQKNNQSHPEGKMYILLKVLKIPKPLLRFRGRLATVGKVPNF